MVYADSMLPPDYAVFGHLDDKSVQLVEKAAAAGTDNANGPNDGHPNTAVDIDTVTVD
jgi:peptidyl-prolyl cis-trans isomerase B (cyclophilin B)